MKDLNWEDIDDKHTRAKIHGGLVSQNLYTGL